MLKALIKIALLIVFVLILLAAAIAALIHFDNVKRDNKEYWGGYGLPTELKYGE